MLKKITTKTVLAIFSLTLLLLGTSGSFSQRFQNERSNAIEPSTVSKPALVSEKTKDYPFFEDFEGEAFPPDGWTIYSQLDDSQNWALHYWQNITPGGTQSAFHSNTTGEESVDNWLVTPQISIGSEGFHHLSFWSYLGNSWAYKKISVLISTASPDPANGDYVEKWAGISNDGWMWVKFFINLEDYVGEDVYIAFRYEGDTWGHTWNVDDVALTDDSPVLILSDYEITQVVGMNGFGSKAFELGNGGIQDLTYEMEIEYIHSDGWLTVTPLNGSISSQMNVDITLDFDAEGLDVGTYQANINISSNDPANPLAAILVTFEVVDVNVYPFSENFDGESFPPLGWSRYDIDGDENEWVLSWFNNTPGGQFSAYHGFGWSPQDGWLVTPQITVPGEGFFYLSFWSLVGDADWYDKNSVLVSTGSGNPIVGDFAEVWTVEEVIGNTWTQHFINIEAFAGQDIFIAFRYEGDFAHYWIIDDIELGFEVDDSPVLSLSATAINQTVGFGGTGNKSFKVINDGILDLTFEVETEYTGTDGWLSVDPIAGAVGTLSSATVSLAFDAAGLDLGIYHANLIITSNDPVNPNATVNVTLDVREAQQVNLTVIYPEYTFPTAISSNGMYVSGSQFGGMQSYLWTMFGGTSDFLGDAQSVTDNGLAFGTYDTEFIFEGMEVGTAGFWDPKTQQWTFLGMNPDVPEFFGSFYNTGYGVTADGTTVVGMQWFPNWNVKAFKWTEEDGYEYLSPDFSANTRANGISANGSVIFGWAEPNWTRTAAIWYNNEMFLIDETQYGEAWGASPSGNYVTGGIGANGFIWSPTEGVTLFQNTLSSGSLSPTTILDDGTVFGYMSGESWPPTPDTRRAFVRHPDGAMETFNEYVESRGWFDASDLVFFSVNDVTPDGNKFIGAAELLGGEWISFMLDLNPGNPTIEVFPLQVSETLELGGASTQTFNIGNAGSGFLQYNALVQYTATDPKFKFSPQGEEFTSGKLALAKKESVKTGSTFSNEKSRSLTFHYDGENVDNIGLVAGGTFYTAVRFPTEMVAPFAHYTLDAVDVYIGDLPTTLKLLVWAAGTTTAPGQVIFEQLVESNENSWNTIVFDSPVELSGADLWVGFEITHGAGSYVMGLDGGSTVMDGNWLSEDGINWEHLSDYGLPGNWNIRAKLSFNGMDWLSMDAFTGIIDEGSDSEISLFFDAAGLESGTYTANIRIASNDAENPLVIIPVTLVVEVDDTSVLETELIQVNVYPNPARNVVHIVSEQKINFFNVVNMLGQTLYSANVDDFRAEFNVSGLTNGMYMVQVFTAKGISTHRLQVNNR